MKRKSLITALILMILFALPFQCQSAEGIWATGMRAGYSFDDDRFALYDGFALFRLPWQWQSSEGFACLTLETAIGVLSSDGQTATVGQAGPGLAMEAYNGRALLEFGVNATLLSKNNFRKKDLGGPIQFCSHGAIDYFFSDDLAIGLRIQHISNAGIYETNPGLNLYLLEMRYRF